jgi:hypothetical protein
MSTVLFQLIEHSETLTKRGFVSILACTETGLPTKAPLEKRLA